MLFHLNVLMKLVKLWLTHLMFVCIVMAAQALYYWGSRECEKKTAREYSSYTDMELLLYRCST